MIDERQTLKRRLTRSRLSLFGEGRQIRDLLEGNINTADKVRDEVLSNPAFSQKLTRVLENHFKSQSAIAARVNLFFDRSEHALAWLLIDSGLDAMPNSAALNRVKIHQLCVENKVDELRQYVAELLKRDDTPEELFESLVVEIDRAGFPLDDPLFSEISDQLLQKHGAANDVAETFAGLAHAMGFSTFARQVIVEASHPETDSLEQILSQIDFANVPAPLEAAFACLGSNYKDDAAKYEPQRRLALVGNSLACGGMERVLARTYKHFSQGDLFDNVDLCLLEFADDGPTGFYAGEADVNASEIVMMDRSGTEPVEPMSLLPGSWGKRGQKLLDHIVRTKPAVIHAWNDLTGIIAAYAGIVAGCPKIIIHFHHNPIVPLSGDTVEAAYYPGVYRQLAHREDVEVIFCAKAAAHGYADWWNLPHSDVFQTVYNGFEWPEATDKSEARRNLQLRESAKIIGTVLRFDPVKQPLVWAEAAVALAAKQPDAHFLVVGDGPLKPDVLMMFDDAGIADRFMLPGQVTNVADYYAAMDVFWLTSSSEGLPNVCIEAQFAGVPVLAFDVGGVGETIVDGETGILIEPDDLESIVWNTCNLLHDYERLSRMSCHARANAQDKFSAGKFFDSLAEVYAG